MAVVSPEKNRMLSNINSFCFTGTKHRFNRFRHVTKSELNSNFSSSLFATYTEVLPSLKISPNFHFFQWEKRYIIVDAACRHEVKKICSGNNGMRFRSRFRLLLNPNPVSDLHPSFSSKQRTPNEKLLFTVLLGLQTGMQSSSLHRWSIHCKKFHPNYQLLPKEKCHSIN
jgi:hypothetical protein